MRINVFLILTLLLWSCSGREEKSTSDSGQGEKRSLTRLAWKMRGDGEPIDSIIKIQRMAVDELKNGHSADDPVEVLEQMGFLYNIAGDYREAMRYYTEASDSMRLRPVNERGDGAIQLFGDISSLYSYFGMNEQAVEYSDSALAESRRQNGAMLSDVYRFRAGIFENMNQVDSALKCYRLALKAVENGDVRNDRDLLKALILGEKAYLVINAFPDSPDSIDWAVRTLEDALKYGGVDTVDREFALGLGYVRQGKADKGIRLLVNAAQRYREQEDVERVNVANTTLLQVYAEKGMCAGLKELIPQYIADADSLTKEREENALVGAMVKYDLRSVSDRSRILQLQLEVERENRIIVYSVAFGVILILLCLVVIVLQRSRLMNQKRLLQEERLQALNESNSQLHHSNSRLTERLDILEKDLTAGMNSNSSILSEPQLITGKEEGKFRRAFNVLFPDFIPDLKRDYPKITPNDELFCMLLYLKHTTDELSIYLGISKASVNSARYRLRLKFALSKEQDLDSFITSRKG